MVPLHEADREEASDSAPKSATAFFAMPTPKRKAPETAPEPPPPSSGPPPGGMPPGMPPGGMHPGMGGVPPMMGGGMMGGGMGIQGPVAGGPVAQQPGFGGAGGAYPPPPDHDMDRATSFRVFAVVGGLMLMVCTAMILMAALVVGAFMLNDNSGGGAVAVAPAPPPPAPRVVRDTGIQDPKPQAKPKPKPRPTGGTKPAPRPVPVAPVPPPAPVGPASATVSISPDQPFTGIEITCPISGFRARASFAGGKATIDNVPQEDCALLFKGGPPARNTIRGGQTKSCEFPNGSAVCN